MIGRVFWAGPVCELISDAQPDFGLLEERDFVRRRQGSSLAGEREYVIKHALTREVAYASLPKAVRGHRHAAFAEWLERQGEGRDEHAPLLAYHYAEAVRPDDLDLAWHGRDEEVERLRRKAIAWSRRAADLAVGRYEIDEGLALLHRALELEPDPRRQADIWHAIGHANALKFDGPPFREAMEKAIELGGPPAELYTELALQAVRRRGMWIRATRSRDRRGVGGTRARALPGRLPHPSDGARRTGPADEGRGCRTRAPDCGRAARRSRASLPCARRPHRGGVAIRRSRPGSRRGRGAPRALLAEVSAPDDRHFALMQAVEVNLVQGRLSAAAHASTQLSRDGRRLDRAPSGPRHPHAASRGDACRSLGGGPAADCNGRASGRSERDHSLHGERRRAPLLCDCERAGRRHGRGPPAQGTGRRDRGSRATPSSIR